MIINSKKIETQEKVADLISSVKTVSIKTFVISQDKTRLKLIKNILSGYENEFIVNSMETIPELNCNFSDIDLIIYDFQTNEKINDLLQKINQRKYLVPVILICDSDQQFKALNLTSSNIDYVLAGEINVNCSVLPRVIKTTQRWNALLERVFRKDSEYQLITENISDMAGIMDVQGNIVYVTPSIENITGFSQEEVVGTNLADLIHPEDMELVRAAMQESIEHNCPGKIMEYRSRHADGVYYWHRGNGKPVIDAYGRIKGLIFNSQEITEQKKLKDILIHNELLLKAIFDSLPYGVSMYDEGRVIYCNNTMAKILGYKTTTDLINKSIIDFVADEDKVRLTEYSQARSRDEENIPTNYEAMFVRKNAEKFLGEINIRQLYYGDHKVNIVILRDITRLKKQAEEKEKAVRLDSLGVLAGGIAHDFNNILTGIAGNISLGKIGLSSESKNINFLQDAEKAVFRARDLTQQMLTFAKGGLPVKKNCSIKEFIKESVDFICHGSKISCDYTIEDDLWAAVADQGQLNQVFTNLIINARDAMPQGGIVEIKAQNIEVYSNEQIPLKPGKYLRIVIKDQGTGIPKKIINKIFDPYFTTKQQGSGLGLASVYKIIRNHEGWIEVDSVQGQGTTFTVYIPAVAQAVKENKDSHSLNINNDMRQKILIMDDEELIRNTTIHLLKHLHYEVEAVENGQQAVEKYMQAMRSGKPYSKVIMDLTIPGGMGGAETLKILKDIDPKVKAIVSSGYSNDPIMSNYKKYGFVGVLTKPYQVAELSEILKAIDNTAEENSSGEANKLFTPE